MTDSFSMRLRVMQTACMTVEEMADKIGYPVELIADTLCEMGYKPRFSSAHASRLHSERQAATILPSVKNLPEKKKHGRGKAIAVAEKAEIINMRESGMTIEEICIKTGRCASTIKRILAAAKAREAEGERSYADKLVSIRDLIYSALKYIPAGCKAETYYSQAVVELDDVLAEIGVDN